MELLVPDLVRNRNRRAASHSLLSIEVIGRYVDFLDALHRRHVSHVVGHRDQNVGRTVDARIIGSAIRPLMLVVRSRCGVSMTAF